VVISSGYGIPKIFPFLTVHRRSGLVIRFRFIAITVSEKQTFQINTTASIILSQIMWVRSGRQTTGIAGSGLSGKFEHGTLTVIIQKN
jgi:hypothetical protein